MAPTRLGQVGLPRLPIAEWAIAFFRGMGDGRVFQPRIATLKRRNSEAIIAHLITFRGPKYTNVLQIRSGVALHTNICPEIFFDHLKGNLSAF